MMIDSAPDLVVGIDSSTTATKAIAWTRSGELIAEGRCAVALASPQPNYYEQDAEDWWRSAQTALRQLADRIDARRVAAVAIANQRETFVPLDRQGRAIRPAITWLDERCRAEVAWLADRLGGDRIHQISGKPRDVTPVAYRLAWMQRHEPDLLQRTAMIADVHSYLVWRMTGAFRTSVASADPFGMVDMVAKRWSPDILGALGLRPNQMPDLFLPGTVLGEMDKAAAAATGLPAGTPIVAGGGDGQLAGLGVNALMPERAYLNLGTAVVSGVYSKGYKADPAWRTMGSGSGDGYYFESCVRSGTFLVDWFVRQMFGADPDADRGVYPDLEQAAAAVPIGSLGLLLVPYWGGVMNPYWDLDGRGAMIGFSAGHRRAHVYRAMLEGIALEQALATDLVEASAGCRVEEYVAIGGGAASDLWCRIIADATGRRVRRSATVEASSLGAGICAAVAAGWFGGMAEAAEAMSGAITREIEPIPANSARYAELLSIYRDIYPQMRALYGRLAAFTQGS